MSSSDLLQLCRAEPAAAAAAAAALVEGVIETARDLVEAESGHEMWTATRRRAAEAALEVVGQGGTGTRGGIGIAGATIAGGTGAQGGPTRAAADGTGTGTTAGTADRPSRGGRGPVNPWRSPPHRPRSAAVSRWLCARCCSSRCGSLRSAELTALLSHCGPRPSLAAQATRCGQAA
jgi:hypothetical protein